MHHLAVLLLFTFFLLDLAVKGHIIFGGNLKKIWYIISCPLCNLKILKNLNFLKNFRASFRIFLCDVDLELPSSWRSNWIHLGFYLQIVTVNLCEIRQPWISAEVENLVSSHCGALVIFGFLEKVIRALSVFNDCYFEY